MMYTIGVAARGDSFYGRARELDAALANRWTWVCGQRRIGKSSLLLEGGAQAQRRGWIPLYYDLARIREQDACGRELLTRFCRHHRTLFQRLGLETRALVGSRPEEAFGELVERLAEGGKTVVFLWDEAERLLDVARNDPEFLDALAACLRTVAGFRLVMAGTQQLVELFPDEDRVSSYISIFKCLYLPGLDDRDARRLLRCEQTGGWRSPLPEAMVEEIVEWCGGHPLLLQEVGDRLALTSGRRGKTVGAAELRRCFRDISADPQLRRIFNDDQRRLTRGQHAVLRAVCEPAGRLSVSDVAARLDFQEPRVEAAVAVLASFGYLRSNGTIRLRFRFYTRLIQGEPGPSKTDARKAERLKPTLFISYCHQDLPHYELVMKYLRPVLRSSDAVCFWSDHAVESGERWDDEIKAALERARVALLLISQSFLDSDYISEVEMPRILARARDGQIDLLCLYVKPSNVSAVRYTVGESVVSLSEYQGLNTPDKPLSRMKRPKREAELAQLSKEIVRRLKATRRAGRR